MDRNSVIGLLAIAAILVTFMYVNRPSDEELARKKAKQDSIEAAHQRNDSIQMAKRIVQKQAANKDSSQNAVAPVDNTIASAGTSLVDSSQTDSMQSKEAINQYGTFAAQSKGKEEHFTIENDLMKVSLSNLGGRITSVLLKKYKTFYQDSLFLFKADSSSFNLNFFTADNRNIFTDDLYFKPEGKDINVSGDDSATFIMRLYANKAKDQYIEYEYTIRGNSYLIDYDIHFVNMGKVISPRATHIYLNWAMSTPSQERALKYQRQASTIFYKYDNDDPDNLSYSDKPHKEDLASKIKWIDFKQQYFSAFLIGDKPFDKMDGFMESDSYGEKDSNYVKKYKTKLALSYEGRGEQTDKMHFYFGPNNYNTLKDYDLEMERIIFRGLGSWGVFRWISEYVIIPLFDFLKLFFSNYGIIILMLTIIIKLCLSPVTYKMFMSSAKMRVLKPEIDEIGKKYKNDAMKKQKATMALHKKAGASPMAGCLPMLIQTPILIALYEFFPYAVQLRQKSFLWATDLSTYDSIFHLPFTIPFYGDHVSLFTLLMAISMFGYTKINMQMSSGAAGGNEAMMAPMKMMTYIMPFALLIWFNSFASALSYYYLLSNTFSIAQALIIRKWVIDEDKIHRKIQLNKAKNKDVKKSKFQQRMESAMQQQKETKKKKK